LDISGYRWEVETNVPLALNDTVDAVVRPEALTVGTGDEGIEGAIESRVYLDAVMGRR